MIIQILKLFWKIKLTLELETSKNESSEEEENEDENEEENEEESEEENEVIENEESKANEGNESSWTLKEIVQFISYNFLKENSHYFLKKIL